MTRGPLVMMRGTLVMMRGALMMELQSATAYTYITSVSLQCKTPNKTLPTQYTYRASVSLSLSRVEDSQDTQ